MSSSSSITSAYHTRQRLPGGNGWSRVPGYVSTSPLSPRRKWQRLKPLRISVLTDKGLVPPLYVKHPERIGGERWRMEYDVSATLRDLGHSISFIEVFDDIAAVRQALMAQKPQIVFNMFEQFDGNALFDQHLISYLELQKIPYTGANPRGLTLARDKALSKKILTYHRIEVPQFIVVPKGHKVRGVGKLEFPLFVKSLIEEGSLGISQASIVYDLVQLRQRVQFIHEHVGTAALVEEYIDGREIYVGVMGNNRLTTFPLWELRITKLAKGMAAIATDKIKWDRKYQKKVGVKTGPPKDLDKGIARQLVQVSKRAYRALYLSGYARLDFRVTASGKIFLLEANPNPDLTCGEDFAESAEVGGISYEELLERIVRLGLQWVPGVDG